MEVTNMNATKSAAPKILFSFTHAATGFRFDRFQTRFGTVEYFLVGASGETDMQGSLGNCIVAALRILGFDCEWVHGQAVGPDWRRAQALNDEIVNAFRAEVA
jgi:hypothetical protein